MKDCFVWNGRRSTEFGVYVTQQPPITVPAERQTFTNVPGRPGSLTMVEGTDVYDDLILTATCILSDPARIPAVAGWLKGSGKVAFPNRESGFYYARIVNQIPFEKILRGNPHCSFAVNFRCKPFRYADPGTPFVLTASSAVLENPGTVYSEPIITVRGNGEVTLMVGTGIVELADFGGSITLDSELQEAYSGTASMNDAMSGDFPILLPGPNAVSWSGDVTSVEIQPNWRYLA